MLAARTLKISICRSAAVNNGISANLSAKHTQPGKQFPSAQWRVASLRGCEFIACRREIPSPTAAKLAILSAKGFASYINSQALGRVHEASREARLCSIKTMLHFASGYGEKKC